MNFQKVDDSVVEELFILSEYIKRNFEENGNKEEIDWVVSNYKSIFLYEDSSLNETMFHVRQMLIQYENSINKFEDIDFFDYNDYINKDIYEEWIHNAYNLTLKYRLSIGDLVNPYDFLDIIERIVGKKFKIFSAAVIFDEFSDLNESWLKFVLDFNTKTLCILVDIDSDSLSIKEFSNKSILNICAAKQKFKLSMKSDEIEMVSKMTRQDRSRKYRSTQMSLYNRSLGIYIWDRIKKENCSLSSIRDFLKKNNLFMKDGKLCEDKCAYCGKSDECLRILNSYYGVTNACIQKSTVLPFDKSHGIKNIKFSSFFFPRCNYNLDRSFEKKS